MFFTSAAREFFLSVIMIKGWDGIESTQTNPGN
jgi:hypothetical protein